MDGLLKKGEEFYAGKDGKVDYSKVSEDAKDAYADLSKGGSFAAGAKAAFSDIQANHKGGEAPKDDDKKQ
ncbi:hypothetical protein G9P44_002799 [Scheffersomyces stipitis]|nr:hypothetical protein G9P44_002799 [Scheffersomyces stipitis]